MGATGPVPLPLQGIPRNPIILLSALPQSLFSRALDAVDARANAVLVVAPALGHDHLERQPHDGFVPLRGVKSSSPRHYFRLVH